MAKKKRFQLWHTGQSANRPQPEGSTPDQDTSIRDTNEGQQVNIEVEDETVESEKRPTHGMIYKVHENPSTYMWFIYGLQQAFLCVSGGLALPFLICNYICADDLPQVRAQLLSITFFMGGVATFLQNTIGVRLPIVQGGSFVFLPPIMAMMSLEVWKCPLDNTELENGVEPWMNRIREIQGNLLLSSTVHMVLGATGLVGVLLRFIGPITVGPFIALVGMGFTTAVTDFAEKHWGVAFFTAAMVLVFSLWLGLVQLPVPSYSKERGCHVGRFPIFVVVSLLLAVGCGWLLCLILTVSGALPSNATEPAYKARTDINLAVVSTSPWFQFPYPFQFGWPTMSVSGFFGMLLASLSSVLESMGDYYAAARVAEAPPPPQHAVNRGIAIEGFSSILSAMVGAGHATSSYSTNIASIAVTRVASRRVFQVTGVILMLIGAFSKVGAVMTLIPDPVIGGLNGVLLGALISLGLAALQYVDMQSPRNVTVVGLTIMMGLAIPQWVNAAPGRIDTGVEMLDQVLIVILGTPMFLGGILGAFLDNIAPGSLEERGIIKWQEKLTAGFSVPTKKDKDDLKREITMTYDLPWVSNFFRRVHCCAYVPFLPSFRGCWAVKAEGDGAAGDTELAAPSDQPVSHDATFVNKTFTES